MSNHTAIAQAMEFVRGALKAGIHPHAIRMVLKRQGVRWNYGFTGRKDDHRTSHQNTRERNRRLKRLGMVVCEHGLKCVGTGSAPIDRQPSLCDECLSATWS